MNLDVPEICRLTGMNEFYLMQQMMRGSAGSPYQWISVALLLVLALVCLFKTDRVRSPRFFRCSCFLFAFSIIVPALVPLLLQLLELPMTPTRRGLPSSPELGLALSLIGIAQPVFLAASVFCLFTAVAPQSTAGTRTEPSTPKPHPLD